MRGQMFIITMVFLAGLVVFVSQLLLSYTTVDVSDVPDRTGSYVVKGYIDIINSTIQSTRNCTDANDSIREMHGFLNRLVTEGYYSNIKYGVSSLPDLTAEQCQKFNDVTGTPSLMNVSMDVITGSTETDGMYDFRRLFIVFPQETVCRDYDRWDRELWCKTEDPSDGACVENWVGLAEDCKTCIDNDAANSPVTRTTIDIVPECNPLNPGLTCISQKSPYPDYCSTTNDVAERTCDGNAEGPPLVMNCDTYALTLPGTCKNACDGGSVWNMCDDWGCGVGICSDTGTDYRSGSDPVTTCTDTCTDSDGGSPPENYFGAVTDYDMCTSGSTCPSSVACTDSCDYSVDHDTLKECACSGAEPGTVQTIDCDPDNHGQECTGGRCDDCDTDGDDWCDYPADGSNVRGTYDCCPTMCDVTSPSGDYQTIPMNLQSNTDCYDDFCESWVEPWDYNCNDKVDVENGNTLASVEGSACTTYCVSGWDSSTKLDEADCGDSMDWLSESCVSSKCVVTQRRSKPVRCK